MCVPKVQMKSGYTVVYAWPHQLLLAWSFSGDFKRFKRQVSIGAL